MQNRIYYYNDGTIGAVWNLAFDFSTWDDLGVGYNYFDGSNWGDWPVQSITSDIAINPSYTKFGNNGEIVASEGENSLFLNYRMNKGEGEWEEFILPGPAGFEKLFSPQIVTTGNFNEILHLLALKKDTSIQFEDFDQDNVCKVIYSRSNDFGITWDILHYEFDFNNEYFGFSELSMVWAEPRNNTLAFVIGDYYTDLILMKSNDGGDNWEKTIIWEHPYPFFEHNVMLVDTFWANSGSQSVALDFNSKTHVSFAVTCIISDTLNTTGNYDWWADGIVYWNQDRPVFTNNINALNSFGHPDSELEEDYSLIGWSQDLNGNDSLEIQKFSAGKSVYPSLGLSTMPSIFVRDNGQINIIWSSVTEGYDNGQSNYRHLWTRSSLEDGDFWDNFHHLTSDLIHIFDECVFPVFAAFPEDAYLHLIYQHDNEPGLHDENIGIPWSENFTSHLKFYYEWPFYLFLLFNADQTTIHAGDTVNYINTSYGNPNPINYQWYFEGGTPDTSTEKHPSVVYYDEGIFDVTLIGSNDLYSDTIVKEDYIIVLPQTGIIHQDKIVKTDIYPNPTTGIISVKSSIDGDYNLIIYSLAGDVIVDMSYDHNTKMKNIYLNGNPAGVYILEIQSESQRMVKKIVLKN
jgi:hypothetical protein